MAMKIDRIQPAGMNVRIQQGKPAYSHVVTVTGPVTDYQAFSQCSDVRMRYFGVASPTSTTIQIGGLAQRNG
jgi:hypothetical protein